MASKARNLPPGGLDFGDYPGDELIPRLATVLGADEEGLLVLAEELPDQSRRRVAQRPDAFRLARLGDEALAKLLQDLSDE